MEVLHKGAIIMPGKYQRTMELLPQIKEMLQGGMPQKQVENELGLSGYRPVHELLKRDRKKELQGITKARGRKPAKTLQEYQVENKRLKMEVELLRDFLWLRCAVSSMCLAAGTTTMFAVWMSRQRICHWLRRSERVRQSATAPTATAESISG